jgi:hypothetical protein
VATAVDGVFNGNLSDHYMKLVEIHAATPWLWSALVAALIEGQWTLLSGGDGRGFPGVLDEPPLERRASWL